MNNLSIIVSHWRHVLLVFIVAGSFALMLSQQRFGQDLKYHDLADRRTFLGIPNFFDVISNLPFLLVGITGMSYCLRNDVGALRAAWLAFFTGVALVSIGSAYYHWHPDNGSLVWDRLPMTVGFMGLFAALVGEYVGENVGKFLLVPALLLGFSSVFYWHWFDDLRFYYWIQLLPLLIVPLLMVLYRSRYSHQWLLLAALGCYVLAKISETHDREMFSFTQSRFSGHSLKHLLAALGCFAILAMLITRQPANDDRATQHTLQSLNEPDSVKGVCF